MKHFSTIRCIKNDETWLAIFQFSDYVLMYLPALQGYSAYIFEPNNPSMYSCQFQLILVKIWVKQDPRQFINIYDTSFIAVCSLAYFLANVGRTDRVGQIEQIFPTTSGKCLAKYFVRRIFCLPNICCKYASDYVIEI